MAHLYRLAAWCCALLLGASGLAVAADCNGYTTAQTEGATWLKGQLDARAACLVRYPDGGWCTSGTAVRIDTQTVGGVTSYRWHGSFTEAINAGGYFVDSYMGSWHACTSTPTSPADAAKAVADSLGKDGELCGLGTPTMTMCYQGYVMRGSWAGVASMNGGSNNGFCAFGPFTADGTTCTGTETGAPSGAPSTCTGGKVPGTVNGVTVCVDPGTVTAPGTSTSGSNSGTDGSGNSTGGSSSTGGSQTSCTGETCTTTTTTTTTNASGGTSTGTTATTQPKSTFCAENPSSPLCTAGSFAGSCGAAPACSGDAVQCAQARYVFETSCSLAKPGADNAETTAYNAALLTNSGDQSAKLEGNSSVSVGAGNFDQTETLGAAAGMSDLSIEVAGKSVTLPLSNVNVWLGRLGMLLQAIAFLLALRIVFRG